MKKIFQILALITIFSCNAQTVVPITSGDYFEKTPNYYKKDVNNEFNKFEGEWVYTNGNTSLTFRLKKETQYQTNPTSNYQDLLVGEYQYVESGIEKVNTLANFDDSTISGYGHQISGGIYFHELPSYCIDNSQIQEVKIHVFIGDPNDDDISGLMILRYVNDNGTEKIQVCLRDETTLGNDLNARLEIPDGYYEMIKL